MKGKKRNLTGGGWSASDHAIRSEILTKSDKQITRTALLSHDTYEKRSSLKLKLHLVKVKRQVTQLKERLQTWDSVAEKAEENRLAKIAAAPPKKKGRLGPETWKLRGAARPSWEVNEFDTRYVCPHRKAHEDAAEKHQRTQNLLAQYKGQLALVAETDECRDYLGLVMQWGHLSAENKQFKSAREAFLEVMELEGDTEVITTAREDLMRLYLQLNRHDAAQRLGQERLLEDTSTLIRYSAAWVSTKLKNGTVQDAMVRAIRCNPFCAYYLAFYDTFSGVMEYTEEMEEAEDQPQSTFEEALEYCTPDTAKKWKATGADVILRKLLKGCLQGDASSPLAQNDLKWEERLTKIVQEYESRQSAAALLEESDTTEPQEEQEESQEEQAEPQEEQDYSDDSESNEEEDAEPLDLTMYAGMFRTAMEMLEEAGEVRKPLAAAPVKKQKNVSFD